MPRIQFTITDEERAFFVEYARRKGLTLSALAKTALFHHTARYPVKTLNYTDFTTKLVDTTAVGQISRKKSD